MGKLGKLSELTVKERWEIRHHTGNLIKKRRGEMKITQGELAKRVGAKGACVISRVECGDYQLAEDIRPKMAKVIGVAKEELKIYPNRWSCEERKASKTKGYTMLDETKDKPDEETNAFRLTQAQIKKVEKWSRTLSQEQVARMLGICRSTLDRAFKAQPDALRHYYRGKAKLVYKIGESIIERAETDAKLAMYYMRCNGGDHWREPTKLEHTSPDGSMTPAAIKVEFVEKKDD